MEKDAQGRVDLLTFIKESGYYKERRAKALQGQETEDFIQELETLLTTMWQAMLQLADDLDKIKDSLRRVESEKSKLQDMVIDQLFEKIVDGPTQ